MTVTVERRTPWSDALDMAKVTSGKDPDGKEPSSKWKRSILKAEHSPIRCVVYRIVFRGIPYCTSVHFVRHKIGVEHFVSTQRPDRTGSEIPRSELAQTAPVTHAMYANAAAILEISRKRLCAKASEETRKAWEQVRDMMRDVDPEMADAMVPECASRGGRCPEPSPCGRCKPL